MPSAYNLVPNSNLNQISFFDLVTDLQRMQGTEEHAEKQQRDVINKIQEITNSIGQVTWFISFSLKK